MKITAVRLIGDKDPVGIFGGWISDSSLDLKLITECTSPAACEFLESKISLDKFGIIWREARQGGEMFPSEMEFTRKLNQDIFDLFTVDYYYCWQKVAHQDVSSMSDQTDRMNNEIVHLNADILARDACLERIRKRADLRRCND